MTGTKLFFLDGPVYVGRRTGILNLARAVADDDCDDIWLESSGRFQDMKKESFSAQRMKHFGKVRLHSGSLTGGKQDHSELVHRCIGEIDYSGSLKAINDRLATPTKGNFWPASIAVVAAFCLRSRQTRWTY